jgi:hypothetical protein
MMKMSSVDASFPFLLKKGSAMTERTRLFRILVVENPSEQQPTIVDLLVAEGHDVVGCPLAPNALEIGRAHV